MARMTMPQADLGVAAELRVWAEGRSKARKRARSVAAAFGRTNLTRHARGQIDDALQAVGVQSQPSLLTCGRDDWVELVVVGESPRSAALPTQIVTWHEHNWTGDGDSGSAGEWLRCLRSTRSHERQLIWSGATVAGIVTFAGWIRRGEGFYEGWGSLSRLPTSIDRAALLADDRTANRFDPRGIKALQGSPITLSPELAEALGELAGGFAPTHVPFDEPDYSEEPILWAGLHGLKPEAYIEAAVAARRGLWRKLGFPSAPARQRVLGSAGRVDLIAGDVVGEAKRAVTLRDGPSQIERYLTHLEISQDRPPSQLRGVLLQCAPDTSQAIVDRLAASRYRLELWSVVEDGRWRLDRLA